MKTDSLKGSHNHAMFSSGSKLKKEEKDNFIMQIIRGMSLKEKVCQMFIIRPESLVRPDDPDSLKVIRLSEEMTEFFRDYPAGGFCLHAENIITKGQIAEFTGALHSLSHTPLLCIDEEGGRVARIANNNVFGLTKYESMTALSSEGERKVYEASRYIGSYVREFGFDVDFAPVADVNTNPENMVIGERAFSDNPRTAATMVVSYLRGLRDSGITGCIKHFPGHGDTRNDTHTSYAESMKTWDEMFNCEMIPFKAGIDAGAEMIMTAHIAAPNVTGSDIPSTMSPVILQEKLRGSLGYKGIIMTDAIEMGAITQKYSPSDAAVETVKAGVDMILLPAGYTKSVNGIIEAVGNGTLSEAGIDESVYRILALKMKKGLLDG